MLVTIMDADEILNKFKLQGHKLTKTRKKMVELFLSNPLPLTATEIKTHMVKINKTTIYRELNFLIGKNFISEIEFGDGKKRYEHNKDHHHHLICTSCRKIENVYLKEDLKREEEKMSNNKNFKILYHSLEFFGLCGNCQ